MLTGDHGGRRQSSTGIAGTPDCGNCPKYESQMRVNTPARARPPFPWMKSRARRSAGTQPDELQGKVGLDGRRQVARPLLVLRPAPVLLLQRHEAVGDPALEVGLL